MKKIILTLFLVIISSAIWAMGDPTFVPPPRSPGPIPQMGDTAENLNQVHRDPAEQTQHFKEREEAKPQNLYPEQQLMEPTPTTGEKIK